MPPGSQAFPTPVGFPAPIRLARCFPASLLLGRNVAPGLANRSLRRIRGPRLACNALRGNDCAFPLGRRSRSKAGEAFVWFAVLVFGGHRSARLLRKVLPRANLFSEAEIIQIETLAWRRFAVLYMPRICYAHSPDCWAESGVTLASGNYPSLCVDTVLCISATTAHETHLFLFLPYTKCTWLGKFKRRQYTTHWGWGTRRSPIGLSHQLQRRQGYVIGVNNH
jgi:hypothetical protein